MFKVKWHGLTDKGLKKLKDVRASVLNESKRALLEQMRSVVKPSIVSYAPSHNEEENVLVKGDDGIGAGRGERFFKGVGQRYVRDALSIEQITLVLEDNAVWANYGRRNVINSLIGFSWKTSKGDTRSTSQGFAGQETWGNLINLWENGGGYDVTSRNPEKYPLRPEDGVTRDRMSKTIPARHMFLNGYGGKKEIVKSNIMLAVKIAAQKEGHK